MAVKQKKTIKKKSTPRRKKSGRSSTIKIATVQALANRYARLRDCFGASGAGCISCGKWFSYEELDGGHYIPTTTSSTRFNEINIWAQCRRCNRFLHGNLRGYFRGLEKKLGRGGLDALEAGAGPHKWTQEELRELRTYYRDKINAIERGQPPRDTSNSGLEMSTVFSDLSDSREMQDVWEQEERDYLSQADV